MNKLKTLIVDDEALARRLLSDYVSKVPELELVQTCSDALQAREILLSQEIDLLFLDIEMPELTGLELLKSLRKQPLTVLSTAYEQYAIQGYELEVIDYLLKPISFERFLAAVNKALEYHQLIEGSHEITVAAPTKDYFFIKVDYQIRKLRFQDILFIEGLREYVKIHTPNKRLVIRQTMGKIEKVLPGDSFIRIHRSYIINLDQVDTLTGNMVTIGEHELPVSKGYKEDLIKRINRDQLF